MDGSLKFWRYSIFTRLIITFLLIMAPIYIIALTIYNWGISNVRQELESSMKSQMGFYINNLETEIQRINSLLYNMIYDDNLTDLANASSNITFFEKSKLINGLQRRLLVLQNSNLFVQNVTAYVPTAGINISATEGMNVFSPDPYIFLNKAKPLSSSQLLFYNNSLVLRALLPLDITYRLDKSVQMISVTLSQDQIRATLQQLDKRPNSGSILYSPEQRFSLSSRPDSVLQQFIQPVALSQEQIRAALQQLDSDPANGSIQYSPEEHFSFSNQLDSLLEQRIQDEVSLQIKKSPNGTISLRLGEKDYFVLYLTSEYFHTVMIKYVPMDYFTEAAHKFRLIFWLFSIVSIFIIVFFSLSTFKFIQQPMLKLVRSLSQLEKGNLSVVITHNRKDEYGYLYHRFNEMVRNLNQLIDQVYKQQILTQHAELKQLQSQINPHFLYNTYFVLYNMAMSEDYEHVKQFTHQLGSYFQYITRNAADDMPMSTEVHHAQTYCEIQSLRFYNRIRIEFDELPLEYHDVLVPRLILQPIIENAFEHGLEDKKGMGLLKVGFMDDECGLTVIVEDNGMSASDEDIRQLNERLQQYDYHDEVTAILNIHRRLILKFGGNSGLTVSRGELGGLKVYLRVELKGA